MKSIAFFAAGISLMFAISAAAVVQDNNSQPVKIAPKNSQQLTVGVFTFPLQTPCSISEANAAPPAIEPNIKTEKMPADDNNTAVIIVNGIKITENQIKRRLASQIKMSAGRIPESMIDQYKQKMRQRIMEVLIIESVLSEKEKEKNITVTDAEVAEQTNKQLAEQNITMEEFKTLLKSYGTDYAEYRENTRNSIAFEKLLKIEFPGKFDVSSGEATDKAIVSNYINKIRATADIKFMNEADKFNLEFSELPADFSENEPKTAADVKADVNVQTEKNSGLFAAEANLPNTADTNGVKAVVDISYPKEVRASVGSRYMWGTTFKETGGKCGFKLTAKDFCVIDPNGDRWTNSWSETVDVNAGGSGYSDFWCDYSYKWAGGYFHCIWTGYDKAGNYISIVQEVKLLR